MKVLEKRPFLVYDCKLCKAKLEAEVSDVRAVRDFDGDACAWIECPICGDHKYLKSSEVPPKAFKTK